MMIAIDAVSRECFRSFAVLPDARIVDADGVFGVVTKIPLTFFNGVATANVQPEAVPRIVDTFRSNGEPFRWWISPATTPADLPAILVQNGMKHVWDSAAMSVDLSERREQAVPAGLDIHRVTDLDAWLHVFLAGFQRPRHEAEVWRRAYERCDASWVHFVGFLDRTPVATTSLLLSGELAGVYHVVTLPAFRGRGIGTAMTSAALEHARQAGARTAALQSSEMGVNVYRAAGFVDDGRLALYDWRP